MSCGRRIRTGYRDRLEKSADGLVYKHRSTQPWERIVGQFASLSTPQIRLVGWRFPRLVPLLLVYLKIR